MANICSGTCRIVARDKATIERVERIMKYDDGEFFVGRCYRFDRTDGKGVVDDGGFFRADFDVDGAWNCEGLFTDEENKGELVVVGYEKTPQGVDLDRPIHGTSHRTGLIDLAKRLGFGIELWSCEPGMEFTEHITLDHTGVYSCEVGDYTADYPDGEDGEPDYDAEPDEDFGFDDYGEFMDDGEIYGDDTEA